MVTMDREITQRRVAFSGSRSSITTVGSGGSSKYLALGRRMILKQNP